MNHNIYQLKMKKEKRNILIAQILIVIMFFSLWELLARIEILDKFLFSCPSEIFILLIQNIISKEIFIHIGYSLIETLIALLPSEIRSTSSRRTERTSLT